MTKHIRKALLALTFLGPAFLTAASAAEIPSGLDQRIQDPAQPVLPGEGAGTKADALDDVERAELARSDPSQRGGGVISTIVIVAAILILIVLL